MRLTLEQLKAMDDKQLYSHWRQGNYPFEFLPCHKCLTQHRTWAGGCEHEEHAALVVAASALPPGPQSRWLSERIEELYALRIFYDHLYPQHKQLSKAEQTEQEKVNA